MTPLRHPGESAAAAVRRLEPLPDYARLMGSEAGQELLREAWREAREARRLTAVRGREVTA